MDTLTRRFRVSLHGFLEGKGKSFRRLQWAGQGEVQEKAGEEGRITLPHFWNLSMLCLPPQTPQPPQQPNTCTNKQTNKTRQRLPEIKTNVTASGPLCPWQRVLGEASPQPYGGTSSHLILSCCLLCYSPALRYPAGPPTHSCSL